jgi:hypothetical protein
MALLVQEEANKKGHQQHVGGSSMMYNTHIEFYNNKQPVKSML